MAGTNTASGKWNSPGVTDQLGHTSKATVYPRAPKENFEAVPSASNYQINVLASRTLIGSLCSKLCQA